MEGTNTAAKAPTAGTTIISASEHTKAGREAAARAIIDINELFKKPYLNEFEAAEMTGRAISTLRNERFLRRGLPYLRVAKRTIRYKLTDVIAFMESRRISFDEPSQ